MWNEKCLRLRNLKDRLGYQALKGQHAPSFEKCVEIILEICGATCSPKYLNFCRRRARTLRDRTPDMTPDQLKLISDLDERFARKELLLKERAERRAAKKSAAKAEKKAAATPAPETPWD